MLGVEEGLTFDDVLLVPAFSEVLPDETRLRTRITREVELHVPLVSAAMDTVTEARLAIAIAQAGGLGVIHRNMPVEQQAREVRNVKKYESGVIKDPITVSPETTVRDVLALTRTHDISGVPVVGGEELVGIVTHRDLRFETRYDSPVSTVMTPRERLVTVQEGASREEIMRLLHEHRIEKVLVVNGGFHLRGLVTVKDIQKSSEHPDACKDAQGRLRAGAAVGGGPGAEERVDALVEAGVDVIVVDTAHGHSQGVINRVRSVKQRHPGVQVVGGNVATGDAAEALRQAGADGVKVGVGPGSICTTRVVAGVGMPQLSAIAGVSRALRGSEVPVIADGGIRHSGDIAKAIAVGAHAVMVGGLFAGTDEAPGDVELYEGRSYKSYRGMGSLGAMAQPHGSGDRYFQDAAGGPDGLVPQGVEGRVPCKGSLGNVLRQLLGGVQASMGYTGCRTLTEMHEKTRLVRVTHAGVREGHVHSVNIVKEPPNYRAG